jgi:hypothetical protein
MALLGRQEVLEFREQPVLQEHLARLEQQELVLILQPFYI